MPNLDFTLTGEYVELHNLLKITGLADSGGTAKMFVASGAVKVDGVVELRKTCKIRAGQTVALAGALLRSSHSAEDLTNAGNLLLRAAGLLPLRRNTSYMLETLSRLRNVLERELDLTSQLMGKRLVGLLAL